MIFSSRLFVSEGKTDRSLAEFSFYECLNFSWAKVPCLSPGDKEKKKEGRKVGKEGGKRERNLICTKKIEKEQKKNTKITKQDGKLQTTSIITLKLNEL